MILIRKLTINQDDAGRSQQPPPPPHKIYLELFNLKHEDQETTVCFAERFLKLIYQLPVDDLSLKVQLDMVYSLLHEKIQSRINRVDFTNFGDLLAKAKKIEEEDAMRILRCRRVFMNIPLSVARRSPWATPRNVRTGSDPRARITVEVSTTLQDPSHHALDQVDSPRNTIVNSCTLGSRQTATTPDRGHPSITGVIRIRCRRCDHSDNRFLELQGRGWFENASGCGRLRGLGRGLKFIIPPCNARNQPLHLSTQASRRPAAGANLPSAQVRANVANLRGMPQRTPAPDHVCRASKSVTSMMRVQCTKCLFLDSRKFLIKGCGLRSGTSFLRGKGRGIFFQIPPFNP